jgi:hypothetical protein
MRSTKTPKGILAALAMLASVHVVSNSADATPPVGSTLNGLVAPKVVAAVVEKEMCSHLT